MRHFQAVLIALFITVGAAAPALGDPEIREHTCAPHGDVVRALSIRFGELRRDGRFYGADYDLELWSSIFGGWTTLMILPDGLTCVTTDGDLWQETPSESQPDPAWHSPAEPAATAAKLQGSW
jgi:hypothetical protein